MGNHKNIHISLLYKGNCLFDVDGAKIKDAITIGRSSDCTWQIPVQDRYASSCHAEIKLAKGNIVLTDKNSTNGTFYKGKKISEIVLKPGMKVVLGDSEIIVEKDDESSRASAFNVLECLNGLDKGKTIQLSAKEFIIGSGEDCQYVCKSDLISRKHTQLRVDERGECWIMDCGSKNGTCINHTEMPSHKERLLKDGDIISVAMLDFRFLDRKVKHVRSYWVLKLLAVVVTIIIGVFCYFMYLSTAANAYEHIQQARQLASVKRFDEAMAVLDDAVNAREYGKFEREISDLKKSIKVWDMTDREWIYVVKMAENKNWARAVMTLGSMQCEKMENWNWNDAEASSMKNNAVALKKYIDVYLHSKGVFENHNSTISDVQNAAKHLRGKLSEVEDNERIELLVPLLNDMEVLLAEMERNLDNHRKFQETLKPLSKRAPDYGSIITGLEKLEKDSVGIIRDTISTYLAAIRKLYKSQDTLLENAAYLTEFEFGKIVGELDLPTADECAIDAQITSSRASIERIQNNFMLALTQIRHFYELFKSMNIVPPKHHILVEEFSGGDAFNRALNCDSLSKKIPNRARKLPSGNYDKLFGIEYFYEIMRIMPEKYDNMVLERMEFMPDCVELRKLWGYMESYKAFLELRENRWLLRGKLQEWHTYCANELKYRDLLVEGWLKKAEAGYDRKCVIYNGLAFYFAADGSISQERRARIATVFKKYREPLNKLDIEYNGASPERAIEIRDLIMMMGLPGDPLVRRVWATKY